METPLLSIGSQAPDFEAETTEGPIRFHEWIGDKWAVLFSHPKDFTPVCTTELGYLAKIKPEFDWRGVKIISLSVDPVQSHTGWVRDIKETQGFAPTYPLISDTELKVAKLYGMLPAEMPGGRNFDEVLRIIDSLQLTAKHQVATPANWRQGEDVIIAGTVSDEDARLKFPNGWRAPKPYLRIVPQPQ
jgi:thioredoxin-dependent peroxiredoxin